MVGFKGKIKDLFRENNWELVKETPLRMVFEQKDKVVEVKAKFKK